MQNTFDLRKFLVENKLTKNSRLISEEQTTYGADPDRPYHVSADGPIKPGLKLSATTEIANNLKKIKSTAQATVDTAKRALEEEGKYAGIDREGLKNPQAVEQQIEVVQDVLEKIEDYAGDGWATDIEDVAREKSIPELQMILKDLVEETDKLSTILTGRPLQEGHLNEGWKNWALGAISALSVLGGGGTAQATPIANTDMNSPNIEAPARVQQSTYDKTTAPSPNEFNKQLQWWKSYIQSSMYMKRLEKEFPGKQRDFLEKERQERLKNLSDIKNVTHFVKAIGNEPGYTSGVMIPKNYKGQYYDFQSKEWKQSKWTPNSKGYDKKGNLYFEKEFEPENWAPYPGYETIPAHEFGHKVDDGGFRIPKSTVEKIYKYTGGGDKERPSSKIDGKAFDYYSEPSEFINRIQPIRYLLKQQGIYDARTQEFTKDDYNKMIKDPTIQQNVHYQDVFDSLKGSEKEKMNNFIDIMNTIASNQKDGSISRVAE
jgi:hypothetical protein